MAHRRPAVVRKGQSSTVGLLYFRTSTHVVLLNNLAEKAHLGRLRGRRDVHIEPEATITVIPIESDTTIEVLEYYRGAYRSRS